jgi:hypothetical protein
MLQSANSSYWYGRILRIYLSTIKFNLNRRHLTLAASRAIHALAALILAGKHIFAPDFWQAVKAHHVPGTLHFIMQALEQ